MSPNNVFMVDGEVATAIFNELGECGGCAIDGDVQECSDCKLVSKCTYHGFDAEEA